MYIKVNMVGVCSPEHDIYFQSWACIFVQVMMYRFVSFGLVEMDCGRKRKGWLLGNLLLHHCPQRWPSIKPTLRQRVNVTE